MRDLAGPSKHALLLEANPASIVGNTIIFELPAHLPFHLERLKTDKALCELLGQAGAEFVGANLIVEFQAKGDDGASAGSVPVVEAEPERAPEKDDLDEEDEGGIDPTSLIVDMLDGEIIDE